MDDDAWSARSYIRWYKYGEARPVTYKRVCTYSTYEGHITKNTPIKLELAAVRQQTYSSQDFLRPDQPSPPSKIVVAGNGNEIPHKVCLSSESFLILTTLDKHKSACLPNKVWLVDVWTKVKLLKSVLEIRGAVSSVTCAYTHALY